MSTPQLRDYQGRTVQKCLDYIHTTPKRKKRPQVVVHPTGSGKSLVISNLAYNLQSPTVVLQPTKEILTQNYSKLKSFGGEASIFSASVGKRDISKLTYATLGSVKNLGTQFRELGVKNLLIDECHFSYNPEEGSTFMNFIEDLRPENTIGFTATPFRLRTYGNRADEWTQLNMLNYGRSTFFRGLLDILQVPDIVKKGYWADLDYTIYKFDDSKLSLNSTGLEFKKQDVKETIAELNINNNIYILLKNKLLEGRKKIIVFMDSVDNCHIMANHLGDIAAVVSGKTTKRERTQITEAFNNGDKLKIILNHSALGIGFDSPLVDTVILGRPTNSLSNIYQYIGRGCRPHITKKYTQIIDFCGNIQRFGKLETLEYRKHPFNKNYYIVIGGRVVSGVPLDQRKPLWEDFIMNKNGFY